MDFNVFNNINRRVNIINEYEKETSNYFIIKYI